MTADQNHTIQMYPWIPAASSLFHVKSPKRIVENG